MASSGAVWAATSRKPESTSSRSSGRSSRRRSRSASPSSRGPSRSRSSVPWRRCFQCPMSLENASAPSGMSAASRSRTSRWISAGVLGGASSASEAAESAQEAPGQRQGDHEEGGEERGGWGSHTGFGAGSHNSRASFHRNRTRFRGRGRGASGVERAFAGSERTTLRAGTERRKRRSGGAFYVVRPLMITAEAPVPSASAGQDSGLRSAHPRNHGPPLPSGGLARTRTPRRPPWMGDARDPFPGPPLHPPGPGAEPSRGARPGPRRGSPT